jgi:hypothetical protein
VKFVLACDESGAKGYADRGERYPGEVGVFAGFLIHEGVLASAQASFQTVSDKFLGTAGKLHITDLAPADQAELRQGIYDCIDRLRVPCFWYAVHVAGFHKFFQDTENLIQQARRDLAARHPPEGPRIKTGSHRASPASLHVELFGGLYAQAVTYLDERFRGDVEIAVRTDRVDNPIVDGFSEIAARLLDESPRVSQYTGFDTATRTVVRGEIRSEIDWPEELKPNISVRCLTIDTASENDGLVLAADVLANSLNHLFKNREGEDVFSDLNGAGAVAKHPLAKALWNWGEVDLVGDRLYRHPSAPPL